MKAVIQRVSYGSVSVADMKIAEIQHGYVILMGIYEGDTERDIHQFVEKVINLRIMQNGEKMDLSILDTKGEVLLVSQFTLCADLSYGRKPSFHKAMKPQPAEVLYQKAAQLFEEAGVGVKTGKFGAYMDVLIHNDGPVTIVL